MEQMGIDRRDFLAAVTAIGGAVATSRQSSAAASKPPLEKQNIKLGYDNFSVRAMGWKAPELIDYAASLDLDVLLMSDLDVYESFDEEYLKRIKKEADDAGVELQVGTGGICPTSSRFISKYGSAEDHLKLLIRVAKLLGSPIARCYLGSSREREGEGGIYRHIESTVKVLKAVRNVALDSDVKIAVENHAGDMQARELAQLIEAAGPDFVGATMDSGNAVWTLEDPMTNLQILGPYAATTGIRDAAIWESADGAYVEWTNIGDGHIDWHAYVKTFQELCPNTAFILEIISQIGPRNYPFLKDDFWGPYETIRAMDFAGFVAMARYGKPFVPPQGRPTGERSEALSQSQQKFDLERSIRYCKEVLGLGLK